MIVRDFDIKCVATEPGEDEGDRIAGRHAQKALPHVGPPDTQSWVTTFSQETYVS